MRDLRSLGLRLRVLHGLAPPPIPRFDPMAAARRYADIVMRGNPPDGSRIQSLLDRGAEAFVRSGSQQRAATIVHSDLHHGNVLTADRVYFIDWEFAQVCDPLLDVACIMAYYPRAVAHGALLLNASGLEDRGVTTDMLTDLTSVFTLLTYLWYRARRVARTVPATELSLESTALRRLLAPDAQPRHTTRADLRESQGAVKRNGDAAGD
jgi:hypothetical protein